MPQQARTLAGQLSKFERRRGVHLAVVDDRPRTRGECVNGPRPCPWAGCKHHLYLDVHLDSIYLTYPGLEPEDMDRLVETCSLDVADRGDHTLEQIGELFNVTRERVRQIETRALTLLNGARRKGKVELHLPEERDRG